MGEEAQEEEQAYGLYWGETHHNTYQQGEQVPPVGEILSWAREYLNFYAGAYYMARGNRLPLKGTVTAEEGVRKGHPADLLQGIREWKGAFYEEEKSPEILDKEWRELQAAIAKYNEPHRFVTFPGFEWQGDCQWGDHNVIYFDEGNPICSASTLPELYEQLRHYNALAIPHHTAYQPGRRSPDWERCDETLSPFMEIYSIHGSSERDGDSDGLRKNSHMGPGVSGGTYEELLRKRLHVGAVGSSDNWTDCPGRWGHGLMGCWARELTREGLWEAFCARRVYAVTGDRIRLMFSVNGCMMGSINPLARQRKIEVSGEGCDRIERIEILRNDEIIHCHAPSGRAVMPDKQHWKLRLEMGWGPKPGEIPLGDKIWEGHLQLDEGTVEGWEPCWLHGGQQPPSIAGNSAKFQLISPQSQSTEAFQNGLIFTLKASPEASLELKLNGEQMSLPLADLEKGSRLIAYEDESKAMIENMTGRDSGTLPRISTPFIFAYKCRIHRLVPESEYSFNLSFVDEEEVGDHVHYRVRVVQRNGQRAWSSPVWFEKKEMEETG